MKFPSVCLTALHHLLRFSFQSAISLFSHSLSPYGPDQRDILLFVNTNNSSALTWRDGVPLRGSKWQPTVEKLSFFVSQLLNLLILSLHLNNWKHRFTQACAAHKTHATVFKTDLWSSGRAGGSIWTCIITSQCFGEVASIQEVLLPVLELCCLLRFMGETVGFLLEDTPHHRVWAWEQTFLVWRHAAYASPLPSEHQNTRRNPQPTAPAPDFSSDSPLSISKVISPPELGLMLVLPQIQSGLHH